MRELQRLFPGEMRAALGRAGAAYRGRMRKIMRTGGGQYGVPKFRPLAALTLLLSSPHKIGGVLANSSAIQMYNSGGRVTIGWISSLVKYASAIQDPESREKTAAERRHLHVVLGRRQWNDPAMIASPYNRPARPVMAPFAAAHRLEFPRWIEGAAGKLLARKLGSKLRGGAFVQEPAAT
jgi:hypothetical protein